MKQLLGLMIPCLLILTLLVSYNLSTCTSPSQSSAVEGQTLRRLIGKEPVFSAGNTEINQGKEKPEIEIDSIGVPHKDEEEGMVYNADYRGVTTHPSPLPKHPKP
ncbi:hypothetical protein MUK42_20942 [Musa troglodytarum]|uniref:Uncharacterized protein n=1 Tax=Musa troglodytarum TaxID=320322 RepID=A0A9E7FYL9_9LILI|nr:hypothetical protein MUK42_20942 [Musa troglodytarum]